MEPDDAAFIASRRRLAVNRALPPVAEMQWQAQTSGLGVANVDDARHALTGRATHLACADSPENGIYLQCRNPLGHPVAAPAVFHGADRCFRTV